MSWKELSMSQRADIISKAVKAGFKDIESIRSFYDQSIKYGDGGTKKKGIFKAVEDARKMLESASPEYLKFGGRLNSIPSNWTILTKSKYRGNKFQQGGGLKGGKRAGDKAGTQQCATWSNGLLRDNGYLISGNAWGLNHVNTLFNGFDGLDKPSSYDKKAIETYNHNAAGNVYNNFDSKTLDKSKPYVVNMYFNGSHSQEEAYKDGKGVTGTHTGILTHDGNRWNVTHNIHGTIHEEPFISLQRGDNTYGVTAVYEPRKDNLFNKVRGALGFADGGSLLIKQIGKKQNYIKRRRI